MARFVRASVSREPKSTSVSCLSSPDWLAFVGCALGGAGGRVCETAAEAKRSKAPSIKTVENNCLPGFMQIRAAAKTNLLTIRKRLALAVARANLRNSGRIVGRVNELVTAR